MSKYILLVHIGNCVKRGNNWIQDTWYDYDPEEYQEYQTYEEAHKAFEKIDLTKYTLPKPSKFLFKEIVIPEYDDDGEITGYEGIDYEERFYQDWIDG